jgi:hypothetical protein
LIIILWYFSLNFGIPLDHQISLINEDLMTTFIYYLFPFTSLKASL